MSYSLLMLIFILFQVFSRSQGQSKSPGKYVLSLNPFVCFLSFYSLFLSFFTGFFPFLQVLQVFLRVSSSYVLFLSLFAGPPSIHPALNKLTKSPVVWVLISLLIDYFCLFIQQYGPQIGMQGSRVGFYPMSGLTHGVSSLGFSEVSN